MSMVSCAALSLALHKIVTSYVMVGVLPKALPYTMSDPDLECGKGTIFSHKPPPNHLSTTFTFNTINSYLILFTCVGGPIAFFSFCP